MKKKAIKDHNDFDGMIICPKCGKKFIAPLMSVWKIGTKVYCSYTCFRAEEKKVIESKKIYLSKRVFKMSEMTLSEIESILASSRKHKHGRCDICGEEEYCADCKESEIKHKYCCAKAYRRWEKRKNKMKAREI